MAALLTLLLVYPKYVREDDGSSRRAQPVRLGQFASSLRFAITGRAKQLLAYLTTDPQVLGYLAWGSAFITLLGFGIALWQIARIKRATDAARQAMLGLSHRVRSRELLVKLGDAHIQLEAAQNHVGMGKRDIALFALEIAWRSIVDAQEISMLLPRKSGDLRHLGVVLRRLTDRVMTMPDDLASDNQFVGLRLQLRSASELLQQHMAKSRYEYGESEGENGDSR